MAKRGNNEGSIFRRKDGRWCAQLKLEQENGRRKRRYFYGASQLDVSDQLLKARSDRSKGLPINLERQTVEEFLKRWLETTLKPNAKPRSFESFETIVNLHIVPTIGRVRLDRVAPQHVAGMLDKLRKADFSPQTIVNVRTVLRAALNQALKWGLVARNAAALVDPPRIPRPKIHTLSSEDARRFLEMAKGGRFEAVYVIALNLGMRRGEILGLRWCDVDSEQRLLRLNQALQRLKGGLQITELKTERSRRVIAMPDSVVRALRGRRARQAQERLASGLRWQDTELVFTMANGAPIEPITLHRDFKRLLSTAKLPTAMRFHDLRHSAASLLLAEGVHLRVIMELLGHSSISLTANTYSHVMPAAMREVADKMQTLLG